MPLTWTEITKRLTPESGEWTRSAYGVLSARLIALRRRGLVELTLGGPDGKTRFYRVV